MSAGPPIDGFYRSVRAVARFWLWFFFKSVDTRHAERVPPEGPVLLCINHPNNFIDSFVIGAVLTRKVHYLATASLFRNGLLARFLLAAGAIPVWRKQDRGEIRRLSARGSTRRTASTSSGLPTTNPPFTPKALPNVPTKMSTLVPQCSSVPRPVRP